MLIRCAIRRLPLALAFSTATLFSTSTYGQTEAAAPGSANSDLADVKAENAALREQLRALEEQQRAILESIKELQRRLDGPVPTVPEDRVAAQLSAAAAAPQVSPPPVVSAGQTPQGTIERAAERLGGRYDDGFVIVETPDASKFPFQLKLNDITQFRYTNT